MPPANDDDDGNTSSNFSLLRELLTSALFPKSSNNNAEVADLADTIHYLTSTLFTSLPPSLQRLSPDDSPASPSVLPPVPPEPLETLTAYSLHPEPEDLLQSVLESYLVAATTAPPVEKPQKVTECEICEREVPLTYHHLIPRSEHKFVLKRGWHPKEELSRAAWLCRPCHSFVHRLMNNRDLARLGDTVEKLLKYEETLKWRDWIGRMRWKERRG